MTMSLSNARESEHANTQPMVSISGLTKTYDSGLNALDNVDLEIRPGEIFALLGPNGAGKTTLISIVCGIVRPTSGTVLVDGHDIVREYRATRSMIGLVPQELHTDMFETVWDTVNFSRGLFGRPHDEAAVERVLRDLSLWDKRQLTLQLHRPLEEIPAALGDWGLTLNHGGCELEYNFNASEEHKAVPALLKSLAEFGIEFTDLNTRQSSLEDIFVSLVRKRA